MCSLALPYAQHRNPYEHSDIDLRRSDKECATYGNPGWAGEAECRCKYPVKSRDENDCPGEFKLKNSNSNSNSRH